MTHRLVCRLLPFTSALWLPLVLWAGGCTAGSAAPAPTLNFPTRQPSAQRSHGGPLGSLQANLEITDSIARSGLSPEPIENLIDTQIEAMHAYTKDHAMAGMAVPPPPPKAPAPTQPAFGVGAGQGQPAAIHSPIHLRRLQRAALLWMPHLPLSSAADTLSEVGLRALAQALDGYGSYGATPATHANVTSSLEFSRQRNVGFIGLRQLDDSVADRVTIVLNQWADAPVALRALVIDFSDRATASTTGAASLVGPLAPGQTVMRALSRRPGSLEPVHHTFATETTWLPPLYREVPILVVVSTTSGPVVQAAVHALRRLRGALVLGTPTSGNGHVMQYVPTPNGHRFGITLAELLDHEGHPLHGQPIVPDLCWNGSTTVQVVPRTLQRFRELCTEGPVPGGAVLDLVERLRLGSPGGRAGDRSQNGKQET